MNPHLTRLHEAVLTGLTGAMDADGTLVDAVTGKASPPDHYGYCATTLALALGPLSQIYSLDDALRPFRAWMKFDDSRIGHLPFNRLLLMMLRQCRADSLSHDSLAQIDAGIARCRLDPDYPSNNWQVLAQTCRVLAAADNPRAGKREADALCALLDKWTTPAGGFIDFPAEPLPGGRFSTPLAYHHKALLLTALAARFHPHAGLMAHLRRLLDWLVHCWDPAGYAGGIGRSNHALFGDACLLGALILIGGDSDEHGSQGATAIEAISGRLVGQQRPDGLLWLDPAGRDTAAREGMGNAAWDNYMYLSVYNAWFAAIVGLCRHLGPIPTASREAHDIGWRADRAGVFHDEPAGVLCLRTKEGDCALVSTRGQMPQAFSRDEVELRYAGGVIAHLGAGTRVAPPVRVRLDALRERPELAGWTPLLASRGRLYGLTDFDSVVIEQSDGRLVIALQGRPCALTRAQPTGPWRRFLAALDWRLLGGRIGRRSASRRDVLPGVSGEIQLALTLDPTGSSIVAIDSEVRLHCDGRSPVDGVNYLNPSGHTVIGLEVDAEAWISAPLPASLPGAFVRSRTSVLLATGEQKFGVSLRWDE